MHSELPEYPVVFMKSVTAVLDPESPIVLPRHMHSDQVDYECELAVVIGKTAKTLPPRMRSTMCWLHLCERCECAGLQNLPAVASGPKAKVSILCPLGPILVTADRIPNPQILPIRTILNTEIRQESFTGDMIFTVAE